MAILASHTRGNLHMAMCVFQCCPLILDPHPSIKYMPSVQTSLTMEYIVHPEIVPLLLKQIIFRSA